jgi:hypothetical protein
VKETATPHQTFSGVCDQSHRSNSATNHNLEIRSLILCSNHAQLAFPDKKNREQIRSSAELYRRRFLTVSERSLAWPYLRALSAQRTQRDVLIFIKRAMSQDEFVYPTFLRLLPDATGLVIIQEGSNATCSLLPLYISFGNRRTVSLPVRRRHSLSRMMLA